MKLSPAAVIPVETATKAVDDNPIWSVIVAELNVP